MTPRRTEFTAFVLDLLAFHRREDRRGMENEPSRIGTSYSSRDNAPVRTAAASRYGWRYTPGGSLEGGSATNSGVIRGGQQQQKKRPFGLVSGRGPGRFRTTHDDNPFACAYAPSPRRSPALLHDDFESWKSTGHRDPANSSRHGCRRLVASPHRHAEGERECGSGKSFHRGPFLGQPFLDELALAVRQLGFEQAAVAADVVAVRSQTSKLFVNHRFIPWTFYAAMPTRAADFVRAGLPPGGSLGL